MANRFRRHSGVLLLFCLGLSLSWAVRVFAEEMMPAGFFVEAPAALGTDVDVGEELKKTDEEGRDFGEPGAITRAPAQQTRRMCGPDLLACPTSLICVRGFCVMENSAANRCTTDSDCPDGYHCAQNRCLRK